MKFPRFTHFFVFLIAVLLLAACAPAAPAAIYETVSAGTLKPGSAVPAPSGEVVLTVNGKISQTNSGEDLQFDMQALESIGVVKYDVDDPFLKENIVYSGPLLSQVLKVAGAAADATTLTLWALDDYSTDMKISDADKWPVLIATQANGVYIGLDRNGPLISVFPFNDFPEIDHLTYDNQWLWALARITVR